MGRNAMGIGCAIAVALAVVWTASGAFARAYRAEKAVIINSGSTNTPGFRMTVLPNGKVFSQQAGRRGARPAAQASPVLRRIPGTLAKRFFADLRAAMSLARLPVRHGMKSASFGTSTLILYSGQSSPDISFPGSGQAQALADDAAAIVKSVQGRGK